MTGRLILWDVDGTLVRVGPVGREALEFGAAAAAGLAEAPRVTMSGKTDPQIVREILALAELEEDHVERLLPTALRAVEESLARSEDRVRRDGAVLPGVVALLGRLSTIPGVRQTLVTGNVAANAVLKVSAFGLESFLDLEIGAYGTDHADRNRLVPIALQRARELRGELYGLEDVWVIGDTPHDLACARAAGVRCLLVATGTGAAGPVRDIGADAVVDDLSDTDAIVALLIST